MFAAPLFCRVVRLDRYLFGFLKVDVELVCFVGDGCSEGAYHYYVVGNFFNLKRCVVVNDCGGGYSVNRLYAANARYDGYLVSQDVRRHGLASVFRYGVVYAGVLYSASNFAYGCVYFAGMIGR